MEKKSYMPCDMWHVTCDSVPSSPGLLHGLLNIKNNRKTKIIAAAEYALDEDEIEEEEKNWCICKSPLHSTRA